MVFAVILQKTKRLKGLKYLPGRLQLHASSLIVYLALFLFFVFTIFIFKRYSVLI